MNPATLGPGRLDAPAFEESAPARIDAWELTRRISPRRIVRGADLDAGGRPINSYPLLHPVTGARPTTPWAVHLADAQGRFHLLCVDLDAKASPESAASDADRLSGWLSDHDVAHLVCASGPTGGRHIWIGLAESIDADLARTFGLLLKNWLPAVDVAPLANPATGCVRPPGAPHRLGGTSRILTGALSCLTRPSVTADQIGRLIRDLAAHVNAAGVDIPPQPRTRPVAFDGGAMPYLPGSRRPLSARCQAALDAPLVGDLSATLWRVLCGAAAAHWRYPDIIALRHAPGLEHTRTIRQGTSRTPRPTIGAASSAAVLRRQWIRAVHAVAVTPAPHTGPGADATFEGRADAIVALVRNVQARADATPGRWGHHPGGLAHRRVLDALCLYHLQAVRTDAVEADIRRLALTCGIDRETARRALLALAADGWISRTRAAEGRRAACWTIDPAGAIHTHTTTALSQADPRPTGIGPALRTLLTRELAARLHDVAHDAFAPRGGLGADAGQLYARLNEPLTLIDAANLMGWMSPHSEQVLGQLAAAGLAVRQEDGWSRGDPGRLDVVADDQGTTGRTQQRAHRYGLERAAWAWWQTELARMRATHLNRPHRGRTRPRAHRGPTGGEAVRWPAHPRHADGRADFAAARCAIQTRAVHDHEGPARLSLRTGEPHSVPRLNPARERTAAGVRNR